jgi:hypothetical protein
VKNLADSDRVLRLMNADLEERKQFVVKPYRSKEVLLKVLMEKFPLLPRELFATVDDRWREKAAMQLEFRRRLQNGENPVMLSKVLVPEFMVNGRRVMDQLRTVSGSKDSLDYVRFVQMPNGGWWQHTHRKVGESWLKDVCHDFCMFAEGCLPGQGRARVNMICFANYTPITP